MDAKKKSCSDHDDHDDDKCSEELELGLSLEKLDFGPKKKLLIMNINGFLLHRAHVRDKKAIPKARTADYYKDPYFLRNTFIIYSSLNAFLCVYF
jgi:hypothetical protein